MSKSVTVNTAEELGKALADQTDAIRIEGNLAMTVIAYRRIPRYKLVIAHVSLVGAIAAVTSGVLSLASPALAVPALAILGPVGVAELIRIGVAAKDPAALKGLRKHYREVERSLDYLVLKHK